MKDKYCVYLTIYKGNKLPPFYIGSGVISKIEEGYRGSPSSKEYKRVWREEKSLFPNSFKTLIIKRCNTREEASIKESEIQHKLNVIENPLYLNKAIWKNSHLNYKGLVTKDAYEKAAQKRRGRKIGPHTEARKRNISIARKANPYIRTEEYRNKISAAHKGKFVNKETKIKLSNALKGKKKKEKAVDNNIFSNSKYVYTITHPDNTVEDVIMIKKWCEDKNINYLSFKNTVNHYSRYKQYKVVRSLINEEYKVEWLARRGR